MKNLRIYFLLSFLAISGIAFSQSAQTEVLYFKADLPCCPARACNLLENNLQSLIEKNVPSEKVAFRVVKLSDTTHAEIVEHFDAKSQTVIIVKDRFLLKDVEIDISDIVAQYARSRNKEEIETEIVQKIQSVL
ncbi:MAG: hypothetical protein ACOCWB_08025 [Bacteroidota bacterium]